MFKKYLVDLGIAVIAVFAPIKTVMITVGVLVIVDMILGMIAAKKRGESINSARMSSTVVKALMYEIAVMMAYLVETYLMSGVLPVCKIVGALIGSVELKSILENTQEIHGQPLFNTLIGQLKKQTEDVLPQPPPPTEEKKD